VNHLVPPSVEYGLLSPMLIIFGVAVLGVLAEAFLPRGARYPGGLGCAGLFIQERDARRNRENGMQQKGGSDTAVSVA
jgi:hypothetical protein